MLLYALGAIVAVVGVLAVVVAMQPAQFRVTRSVKVAAGAPAVFAEVNDLHRWEAWSPWAKIDPQMKLNYSGAAAGSGACYEWSGNSQVGAGRTTITESRPGELVRIKLEMFKPFKATNDVQFTFQPEGEQTVVTWSMDGTNNFLGKAVGLLMNMDKMVGGQFEQGLASLKSVVEAKPKL
jgi:hypothetical protein